MQGKKKIITSNLKVVRAYCRSKGGCLMEKNKEIQILDSAFEKITDQAKQFGLDFYDMIFEICPADIIYTFGAYGMPTRFSHWTFGKAYHKMKTQYDYNLGRIYEMVINSNPC
jgi:stage V sporulation protein R